MMVSSVLTSDYLYNISGVGYNPHGSVQFQKQKINPAEHPTLKELARAALQCNDAVLLEKK